MIERPIIFNAEMVNAILSGCKTQTRRIVKDQRVGGMWSVKSAEKPSFERHTHDWWLPNGTKPYSAISCPFGAVGARLWVRETWQGPLVDYDEAYKLFKNPEPYQKKENCVYRADGGPTPEYTDSDDEFRQGWRPSIHMPRWASRITLEITGVRVERLHDISEEDAKAEGVPPAGDLLPNYPDTYLTPKGDFATAKVAFQRLWQSIYGAESWQANPWVWCIEFKLVDDEVK